MTPQANSGGSGQSPGTPANRRRNTSKGARPASSVNSSSRNQVTESVNSSESTGKVRPPVDQSDDRVVVVSSDEDAVTPAGDGEDGDATLRIRSSSVPDWSPSPDGGGPTRPSQKPPAGGAAAPASPPGPATTPRPGGARLGPGGSPAAGSPGAGGTPGSGRTPGLGGRSGSDGSLGSGGAAGPGGRTGPASAAGPGSRPGSGSKQGGLGAVSALATPEPMLGRSEQRDKPAPSKAPRKAHLVLRRVEPWSAMKFSFVVSLVCFVVLFVAVAVLYGVLSALGVFDSIVNTVTQLTVPDGKTTSGIDIKSWFEPVRILGYTALLGAVNVVLITALSTLGAVIYNVASDLVGGVEVTFSEAE